jgi:hypothetical protein
MSLVPLASSSSLPTPSSSFAGQYDDAGCIIRVLSAVLTQLIDVNHKSNNRQHFVTKFQSSYAPNISIQAYLERINKYAKCSPNCFIVALIYIDRLIEMKNIVLTSLNVHRILITSILLSTKVFDDEFYKNAYYAKLGGVSTSEMNTLEVEFLSLVNFNLYVSTETFEKYQQELQSFQIIVPSPAISLSSLSPPHTTAILTDATKKNYGTDSGHPPRLTVPDCGERISDPDPNSISPLRPFDVNNLTTLRSVLFHTQPPHFSVSSHTTSLLAPEDSSHPAWPASMSSNPVPITASTVAHDSPRSLASYPSSDPSPTLQSTRSYQKPEILHPDNRAYVPQPSNNGSSLGHATEGEYMFTAAYPMVMAPPHPTQSFPRNLAIPHSGPDLHTSSDQQASLNISVSTQPPLQKYQSRHCDSSHAVIPTQQKTHSRVSHHHALPSYPSRYPAQQQHSYEARGGGSSGHLQHYDASLGYLPSQQPLAASSSFPPHPSIAYHPTSCGYFPPHPSTQQPYCPSSQNYHGGPSQMPMQYAAPPPPQQMQYMGGYYYQPVPSPHMVPGPRYLAPSTTPNSVADMFVGPSGGCTTPLRQTHQQQQSCASSTHQSEEQYYLQQRSNSSHSSFHRSAATGGYGGGSYSLGVGLQHPYYAWSEQHDMSCSTASGLHLQHHGLPSLDVNSYPATSLFYPVPLRTVS